MRLMASLFTTFLLAAPAYAKDFTCWGPYSDIVSEPVSGDLSGLEITLLAPEALLCVVAEGSVTGTMAKDINISGQEITFQCFGHTFRATCTSKGLTYQSTGGHRGLLRRGTFFKKRDWPFQWEP